MTKSALIQDGVVVDLFEGSSPGAVPASEDVDLGWYYFNGAYSATPPPPVVPPVPEHLTSTQFMLVADSVLEPTGEVEEAIAALIDADQSMTAAERRGLLIRLRNAQVFPRDWPHIDMLAPGLTSDQIDDLFRWGATL